MIRGLYLDAFAVPMSHGQDSIQGSTVKRPRSTISRLERKGDKSQVERPAVYENDTTFEVFKSV